MEISLSSSIHSNTHCSFPHNSRQNIVSSSSSSSFLSRNFTAQISCKNIKLLSRRLIMKNQSSTTTEASDGDGFIIEGGGYKGFYSRNTIQLTLKVVNDIHKRGGTFLQTSRGGHDTKKIVDNIQDRDINQVYIIGGDRTHKGVAAIYKRVTETQNIVNLTDRMWARLLASSNQPSFLGKPEFSEGKFDKETMDTIKKMQITSA